MDKPRILIVEDDTDLAEMLKTYFGTQGYEVRHAAYGEDGLRMSRDEDLSLVVLDIRLPDISGYDVCRSLRGQRRTQDTPIIFLTEKRERVDKLTGLELGVVDYITKPFDIQELKLRVRNAITRANVQSQLHAVTGLPDAPNTQEKLIGVLFDERPWAVLWIAISGLDQLREAHGFVASDDLMRAVVMMTKSALREFSGENDFLGHYTAEELVVITTPERAVQIQERVDKRIRTTLAQFYRPIESDENAAPYLQLHLGSINSTWAYNTLDDLNTALIALRG
jgi:PleD family two-component response regulator